MVAGVVSAKAAFCGLTEDDIRALCRRGFRDALVLVRYGLGRRVVPACQVDDLVAEVQAAGDYVRDVSAVAS